MIEAQVEDDLSSINWQVEGTMGDVYAIVFLTILVTMHKNINHIMLRAW